MKKILILLILSLLIVGCDYSGNESESSSVYQNNYKSKQSNLNLRAFEDYDYDYDYGYEWAENNDIDNFDDCQDEFGTSEAEDGCNEYVKDNYTGSQTFGGYECTEDCAGHNAGYEWAENNDISDIDDCGGKSQSFIEGCWVYVEDNY